MSTVGRVPRVLSIAGTDPSGGAGIQADLKSIAANGGYGMAVVTALVAQNTTGVRSIHVPPVTFLAEQLDAVSDDVEIDAVKIGMLGSREVAAVVAAWLDEVHPRTVVLDPVMVATSGDLLLDRDATQALRDLVAKADLVTPNVPELALLAEGPTATTWEEVLEQARLVSESYGVLVLAKGGHLEGAEVLDALVDAGNTLGEGTRVVELSSPRIETTNTHGTGCSLSSAVATVHARTGSWSQAVRESKRWLTESIAHGPALRVGKGHGPVSHFAGLWARGGTTTGAEPAELAADWWASVGDVRSAIDELAFVRALEDGTLSPEAFRWYLEQDALYLRDFARVLADLSRTAPTADEQTFWAGGAHAALTTELQLHTAWLAGGRTEDAAPVRPSRTTTAYLDHLLATAARADHGTLVAAVLPCYWLYADLGNRLQHLATEDHPYRDWLLTYGDPVFAQAAGRAVEIATRHAVGAHPDARAAMWRAYRTSAEHELAFFAAPLRRVEHG